MKKNKEEQVIDKNELQAKLKEARKEFFQLKLDNVRRKLKDTSSLSRKRKEIARFLTKINEMMGGVK